MTRTFKTAAAFKTSLEAHLRTKANERGVPSATVRFKFVPPARAAAIPQAQQFAFAILTAYWSANQLGAMR